MKRIPRPTWATLRVPIIGLAASALAISGVSVAALVARPASTSSPEAQSVQLVEPAGEVEEDETTTTTTTGPVEVARDDTVAVRAEVAATRAEVAAGRAEVAVVRAEEIVTTTTTTVAPTTSTTSENPVLADVTPTTTATVPAVTYIPEPKAWVVVARFPIILGGPSGSPVEVREVSLRTGQLRVSGFPSMAPMFGTNAIWLGDGDYPEACRIQDTGYQKAPAIEMTDDCWVTGGLVSISAGRSSSQGWVAPHGAYSTSTEIIVEEYR
jgi:hypothetical protein